MTAEDSGRSHSEDRRRSVVRTAAGVTLVAGLMVVTLLQRGRSPAVSLQGRSERRNVPAFWLPLLSGGTWRSEDHRGHVVVLNVWATWCLPCRRELPILSELAREEGARGLDVVGVVLDTDDRRGKVEQFLRVSPVSYPIAVPEQMPRIGPAVEAVPTTLLMDREGRVAAVLVGAFDEKSLRGAVVQLLRER